MNKKNKLSIIGGTGNLGIPVVKFLLKSGFEIKLIVRNVDKAEQIFEPDSKLEIIKADLENIPELKRALTDTEYLYLNLSTETVDINISFSTEREGMANILKAVNRDKIRQIITISGLGAIDNVQKPNGFEFIPNIIRKQGHKLLKSSGIPYTILHCSWFADSFVIYRQGNEYSVIGNTTEPIFFINAFDYTNQLINALGNPDAFFKEFPIQGKKGFAHPEAAKIFFNAFAEHTKITRLPKNIIKIMALLFKGMRHIKHMSDYFTVSHETFLVDEYNTYTILGTPSLSLTEYSEKLKTENIYSHLEKNKNNHN